MITKGNSFENAKGVIALFILVIAFVIFMIFYNNQDYLMESNNLYLFITLATVAVGLLLALFYLVSNSSHPHKAKAVAHKSVKSSKSSKKSAKKRSK